MNGKNGAISAEQKFKTSIEEAYEYIENFDILETINNVGNDEIFTPVKLCNEILDVLPSEVWSNPEYKWLNPCDKNGVFLREAAIRLDEGLKKVIKNQEVRRTHILKNMLFSIGLTKFTSLVSRRTVYYCSQANRAFSLDVEGYAIGNGKWFDDEEGNIKTPMTEHKFDKTGKCVFCRTSTIGKYVDPKQIEHYAYEFIHTDDTEKYLQERFFRGENMKFDIIIGNPPYQLSDGGAQSSAKPIYQLFVQKAKKLNPKYLTMIIPSRWMSGGKGLDQFREEMITDTRISVLHDYLDASHCFPNNSITGGVCYFLWENNHNNKCKIHRHDEAGNLTISTRYLKEKGIDILIRDEIQKHILTKVQTKKEDLFSEIVSPLKPYGLRGDFIKNPSKYGLPPINNHQVENSIEIIGVISGKRVIKYLDYNYPIPKRTGNISLYKIFINESDGAAGYIGNPVPAKILGTPIIGFPNQICTETFLEIGPFLNEVEASNALQYTRTKFFRLLLGIKKISQHMTNKTYDFIPKQDFTTKWTDNMLYEKYSLSKEEIEYIEYHIKEMD